MAIEKKRAKANLENMHRVFTVPEEPSSTLSRIENDISQNIAGFLQAHIVAVDTDLSEVEKDFSCSQIPEKPMFVSEQADFLLKKLVAQSVHTASPRFIGHMTSAIPHFMLPLSKIMIALNQNLVKTETSKAFTPLERQVIGMLHRLVYQEDDHFYQKWMHNSSMALGSMGSGGTVANITSLWVARNSAFPPEGNFNGIKRSGLYSALNHYGYKGAAILVSKMGHYSLSKAADILGLGRDFIIPIDVDEQNKICLDQLRNRCIELKTQGIKILAIVGIAGTTETGNVDPLNGLADISLEFKAHYHVDAAWGGPTLFSNEFRELLDGIDRADSVTIDAHKQLYIPMGCGLALFKDPKALTSIEHHAQYIIRKGSKDLGSKTLEGSRAGMAMLIQSGLKIIAKDGYELLIDLGIHKAKRFAEMVQRDHDFELITEPELNILTYRYCPAEVTKALQTAKIETVEKINRALNEITKQIQKSQRSHGKNFVSRTKITPKKYREQPIVVFRVVMANPLTTSDILSDILLEQKKLAQENHITALIDNLRSICVKISA